ncbi:MAG: YbaB/EbfC family nucleoid-associated protein [Clostridium sp.]|jgi:DNA-binding YbaB/EbfC family protein|uniref:YbaB/EbfC family nucleoid-associated protein n=1 Tax=Clostridium sp. TaxID=1506 RepID=UPI0025C58477|nr:YbaB/EbfC family nucleoid-associated protein [Clostridium sp.]MCH3965434.1 YbaB/EbfC family nucleoid-associated protein [Clostridium sp.]MCI1717285.1 YbaB/EbfC family nucleoid-associated protein [Clostridium sp.]MCI1801625.1 YbaB/EbfC family nucleoid-associated protein [Clostridium sp.]MCI1815471.1 YbaB/EbfC family nucleoid-associated protein [Clostridium sp.]MCI1872374.1 YbaB/EbfC family nucleoid-associated protein [Clostridium sp.]
MARGGFPNFGGGGNMNNFMKQAQKMQKQMQDMQEELENKEFTATAGGGAVTAVVNGKKYIKSIKIKPEVIDPDDVEMIEDLVLTACNEALKNADEQTASDMKKLTGGLNIPGMF